MDKLRTSPEVLVAGKISRQIISIIRLEVLRLSYNITNSGFVQFL